MIAYIGAGLLVFGLLVMTAAASFSLALIEFIALGGFVAAMGVVLVILGLQAKPPEQVHAEKNDDGEDWEFEIL